MPIDQKWPNQYHRGVIRRLWLVLSWSWFALMMLFIVMADVRREEQWFPVALGIAPFALGWLIGLGAKYVLDGD
jgi:hypothetical protein